MSNVLSRVKKLEEAWDLKHSPSEIRTVFLEPGESKKAAMKKAGIYQSDNHLTIFFKWDTGDPELPRRLQQSVQKKKPNKASIDAEISQLKKQLKEKDGLSDEEIENLCGLGKR